MRKSLGPTKPKGAMKVKAPDPPRKGGKDGRRQDPGQLVWRVSQPVYRRPRSHGREDRAHCQPLRVFSAPAALGGARAYTLGPERW